ncbi:MAG: hemerythrin domain-containing protein [Candidatus Azobacteroides sp.]|nr:hemerythrin domain-containing protein [Candidatus Azobacteroides sp.]
MSNPFSQNTKMADLILANSRLLSVLPYFGINLGFGEKTVKQVCNEKNVSIPLLLLVCNSYTFDNYSPSNLDLVQLPIDGIIRYLENSHKDFLEIQLPQIIDNVLDLVNACQLKNGYLLYSFCERYRQETVAHFQYEEDIVFPYISELLKGIQNKKYNIKEYKGNHSDIDSALTDLKNIIIKYLPPECTIEKCKEILQNLFAFEYNLTKHTLLENNILITVVELLEKKYSS